MPALSKHFLNSIQHFQQIVNIAERKFQQAKNANTVKPYNNPSQTPL